MSARVEMRKKKEEKLEMKNVKRETTMIYDLFIHKKKIYEISSWTPVLEFPSTYSGATGQED